jgi:hypothetical protein
LVCQRLLMLFILSLPSIKIFDSLIVLEIWQINGFCWSSHSSYILNAEIPLFSLKIKSLILRIMHSNWLLFLFCCWFFPICIPLVIICVLLSIVSNKFYWMGKKALKKATCKTQG